MDNNRNHSAQPGRSVGRTLLWIAVWIIGAVVGLFGLAYLSCGGACT